MSEILPSLGFQLGAGAIGGFIVGYAVKKISKLVAILVGLFIALLIYLGTSGVISINYGALWNMIEGSLQYAKSGASWFISIISLLPFAGSFIAGLLLGFKVG
jgi:uncharacterized membrane protein (Fun14 family)